MWQNIGTQIKKIEEQLSQQASEDPNERIYRSAPGIGPLSARILFLENEAELPQSQIEKSFQDLMESMSADKTKVGSLAEGIEHFLKIKLIRS